MAAVIFSGNNVKTLKSGIDINGNSQIQSGSVDPSSSATTGTVGSLYLNTSSGNLYRKLDAGSSTNWSLVGSASGGVGVNLLTLDSVYQPNAITNYNAETSVGSWAAYADAAAVAPVDMDSGSPNTSIVRSTSSPLDGVASFLLTKSSGASRQGEGVRCAPVYIPPGYRGKTLEFRGVFSTTGTIVEDDFRLYAYDITNSLVITPFSIQKILGPNGTFRALIPVGDSTATLRIGIHIASTTDSAVTIKFDDVELSSQPSPQGLAGSDWTSFTGTLSAGFGTTTSRLFQRRVGDSLEILGSFTVGTTAATTASLTIPTGLKIDTSKITLNQGTTVGVGSWIDTTAANTAFNAGSQGKWFIDSSSTTDIFLTNQMGDGTNYVFQKKNGNNILSSGNVVNVDIKLPIAGWSSSLTLGDSSSFLISKYLASGTRVTGSAPTLLGQYRSYIRNSAAFSITETNGSPGVAPSVNDGIKIYNGNTFSSADTNNEPAYYDIFIGKNKSYKILWYSGSGRTGQVFTDPTWNSTTTTVGYFESYDPTTGVLSLSANRVLGGTSTHASGYDQTQASFVQDPFFDILVSENALAVGTQLPRSEVFVQSSNGFGSTNTRIARYSNTLINIGSAISYSDSGTLGGSFTINEPGVFAMSLSFQKSSAGSDCGISRNSTQLTTSIFSITAADRIIEATQPASSANFIVACSATAVLNAGDVIRVHSDATTFGSNVALDSFRITKVSN